jgi:hypothetical protein
MFHLVISAENNPYMAWQSKLFFFSCVTRARQFPTIMVHSYGQNLHPGYVEIAAAGGRVKVVPSYSVTRTGEYYVPRNTAGTLLHAADLGFPANDFLVICDPDMIFVQPPEFPRTLSANHYDYMNYDQEPIIQTGQKLGITSGELASRGYGLRCGTPYVIPMTNARSLAETWLEAIDALTPHDWIDSMYAFGLAAMKLRLTVEVFDKLAFNEIPDHLLDRAIIHYCYGSELWTKRDYMTEDKIGNVWTPSVQAPPNTVLAEILSQIEGARNFYSRLW